MPGEQNAADFVLLMHDWQADRFFQNGPGDLHFQIGEQAVFRAMPARQQFSLSVEYLRVGNLFGRGDHFQRFRRRRFVVEHYRSFYGVADRPGDQVQVVVSVNTQCQNAEQRQRDTGHRHRQQRHG